MFPPVAVAFSYIPTHWFLSLLISAPYAVTTWRKSLIMKQPILDLAVIGSNLIQSIS